MPLRVGIVGCGKIADGHVEEISKQPHAAVAAVCDIEPLMAERMGVRYGIAKRYCDFDRMLETERLDVLHITTPPASHPLLSIKAMDAGCHVYVEKPLAIDSNGARAIVDHARRTGRKLTINYWPNYDPIAVALDRLLQEGTLGEPVHVESFFGYNLSGDFGIALLSDPGHWVHQLPGKLLHNVLDHIVNKVALLLPDAEPQITATGYRRRPATGNRIVDGVLDELRFIVRGQKTSAYGTFCAHAQPVHHFLRVYGTRKTAHVDYRLRTLSIDPEQNVPSALGRLGPSFSLAWQFLRQGRRNVMQFARSEFHYFAGMRRLMALFYDSILQDGSPPISYDEIVRVSVLMDRIIAQVQPMSKAAEESAL